MGHRLLVMGAGTGLGNNVVRSLQAGDPSFVIVGCHTDRFALTSSSAPRNYVIPSRPVEAVGRSLRRIIAREAIDLYNPNVGS